MKRAYYQSDITEFLQESEDSILGKLTTHQALEDKQRDAWKKQIKILQAQLQNLSGYIYFEFTIPRMGKRIDNILIIGDKIFLFEFKINAQNYLAKDIEQVIDYALDLRNFHQGSHYACLIPVLIAEQAPGDQKYSLEDAIQFDTAIKLNASEIYKFLCQFPANKDLDIEQWEHSSYKPTPTIVEAAQALYQKHNVVEITRSDAGAENLSKTANCISAIIEYSKENKQKSICFITGVPGAGKTLAGLNIANQRLKMAEDENAVFLSGNGPLVIVLQEALVRSSQETKKIAYKKVKAFIQNIHHFRDEYIKNNQAPTEKVVIFDEAQRAWDYKQVSSFMKRKRGIENFTQSEPQFLIDVMDRHKDWCTIICLIGGGQEINTGESGLEEWITALREHYPEWHIYYSDLIINEETYLKNKELKMWLSEQKGAETNLHLATSIRAFRSEKVSAFIQNLLNMDQAANTLYEEIKENYPIVLTRDLYKAKQWLSQKAKGSERSGLIASSGARRLKALGVDVKNSIDVANWFLNPKDDVRSSYFLEEIASEFDVQGLELDWVCVGWDINFYPKDKQWHYQAFKGNKWQKVRQTTEQNFLKNAYRVLLTRARQGMIIWIPEGNDQDPTRPKELYNHIYQYLKEIGIEEYNPI